MRTPKSLVVIETSVDDVVKLASFKTKDGKELFIHWSNPHYSATWADVYFDGWHFVIAPRREFPIEPMGGLVLFQHKNYASALDVAAQLEEINVGDLT